MNIEELRAIAAEYGAVVERIGPKTGDPLFLVTKHPNQLFMVEKPPGLHVFCWQRYRFETIEAPDLRRIFEAWGLISAKSPEQEPSRPS